MMKTEKHPCDRNPGTATLALSRPCLGVLTAIGVGLLTSCTQAEFLPNSK